MCRNVVFREDVFPFIEQKETKLQRAEHQKILPSFGGDPTEDGDHSGNILSDEDLLEFWNHQSQVNRFQMRTPLKFLKLV